MPPVGVRLEPWTKDDHGLLARLLGDPAMMEHLGGPEDEKQIAERQTRYEASDPPMLKIVDDATGEGVGWVGYWEREWRGETVHEIGWLVLPKAQRRGIATRATALAVDRARQDKRVQRLHAYPSVDNVPSNALCRKLGFVLVGTYELEYPKGRHFMANDWRLDLAPPAIA